MKSRQIILILSLLFNCLVAQARQSPVEIPSGQEFSILLDTSQVFLLRDDEHIPLMQALERADEFVQYREQIIEDRYAHFWARIKVYATTDDYQRLYLYTSKNDNVHAYLLSAREEARQEVLQESRSGSIPLLRIGAHLPKSSTSIAKKGLMEHHRNAA